MNVSQITLEWMYEHGLASGLLYEKCHAPGVIAEKQTHIRETFGKLVANLTLDEAYHVLQQRSPNTRAIHSCDEATQDLHLEDTEF